MDKELFETAKKELPIFCNIVKRRLFIKYELIEEKLALPIVDNFLMWAKRWRELFFWAEREYRKMSPEEKKDALVRGGNSSGKSRFFVKPNPAKSDFCPIMSGKSL